MIGDILEILENRVREALYEIHDEDVVDDFLDENIDNIITDIIADAVDDLSLLIEERVDDISSQITKSENDE